MFGIGYTPLMPGTAACVVAMFVFILVKNTFLFVIVTIVSLIVAYALSGKAEKIFGEKDCKKIVIDDFAGMLITYLFIPHETRYIVIGFFLFRMFDMLKVPPADKLEKLSGSRGIVGDDVVAGIYANVILHIARMFAG